jgi:hypothetical protein
MTARIAMIAAYASAFLLAQFGLAQAQNRQAINTTHSNIKHGGEAAPGKPSKAGVADSHELEEISTTGRKAGPGAPKQNRQAINTSRSNIKHQGLAASGKPKPAQTGQPIPGVDVVVRKCRTC